MFNDPSRMNVGTLFPHEIAYNSVKATTTATIDYQLAAWEKKVLDGRAEFEKVRQAMAREAKESDDTAAIARAMATGNIVGVADVSSSMCQGKVPNQPIDIAMGLVAYISSIASPHYRDIAFSFTDVPTCFHFKVGNRPMNVRERMTEIVRHVGYNTNYMKLHEAVIDLCVKNRVPEEELPVLYMGTDGNFDTMDNTIGGGSTYNYTLGRYETTNMNPARKWETTHASIVKMWLRAGYSRVPLMVYHNLASTSNGVQEDQAYKGVILLGGRSEQVIKLVLYGEAMELEEQQVLVDGVTKTMKVNKVTPYDTFRKAMEGDHFNLLESVLRTSEEGVVAYFV
jgi:hypothetical protein